MKRFVNVTLASILGLGSIALLAQESNKENIQLPDDILQRDYDFLKKYGVSHEAIVSIQGEPLKYIVDGFEKGDLSKDFIPYFSATPWEYSIKSAEEDSDFNKGREWMISNLTDRVSNREHAYRINADYKEDISQIKDVKSIHMLTLLKKYFDFFDSKENLQSFNDWFKEGENSYESGAIILSNKRGYEKRDIDTDWQSRYFRPRINYSRRDNLETPFILPYIENIGFIHCHIKTKRDEVDCISGPSGSVKPQIYNVNSINGDTDSLVFHNGYNPLSMWGVVTWIDENKRNVDIFFRDIELEEKKLRNRGNVIVIDLGVYDSGEIVYKKK